MYVKHKQILNTNERKEYVNKGTLRMKNLKDPFEFKTEFIHKGFIIMAKEWHIVPGSLKKNQALVQAFGTDGEKYDGIAIFKRNGKCKSLKVDSASGRWEEAFWEEKKKSNYKSLRHTKRKK